MKRRRLIAWTPGRPLRRRLAAGAVLAAALGLVAILSVSKAPAVGASSSGEPTPQTDASVPLRKVTMIGSSPLEASDETWGVGITGEGIGEFPTAVVRYTAGGGWALGPQLQDTAGRPLAHFTLDRPQSLSAPSPLAGQITAKGSGVLAGIIPLTGGAAGAVQQILLVRDPDGAFREVSPVPSTGEEALLEPGETLFGAKRAPLIAPLDESGGQAGALVVPVGAAGSTQEQVLHWDGHQWTSEPIEVPGTSEEEKEQSGFQVLAIGAGSPENAWLLAQPSSQSEAVALYRRSDGAWKPVSPAPLEVAGEPLTVPGEPEKVEAQVLTVTGQGVWVDAQRAGIKESTTIFFKPEGALAGSVLASWCRTPGEGAPCKFELPEELPTSTTRSFAWASSSAEAPYGERVITGFPEGVSLRLDGSTFIRVLALGGSASGTPGGAYGAAFVNPREGWLGEEALPVHLTLSPVASRLAPWPVSFRHTLLAVAPAPGAPVGALSSEAIAVGDEGEVARYEPGKGWMPESLFGPGERRESPRLRAVAWPSQNRIHAVGDEGQMWLWRGETGLWEPDPATPVNFRGNLLGVAFDPANPSRGYAVGESGVLLRYGKTWTQETALPAQVAGASFTSIAFAGSEAIVAYRQLPDPTTDHYVGGLLVNDGSGWRVDDSAVAAADSQAPWTVAALPDGGAGFSAEGFVYERSGPGQSWQKSATPLPGGGEPGSLALFREAGALRAIAAGTPPDYFKAESEARAQPGFPPTLIKPYPLVSNSAKGVLRQTVSGWSDEQHELNDVREPAGNYARYDTVYQPDPVSVVLVDPAGAQGWAVGGFVETEGHGGVLDTADVDRYPAEGTAPVGVGSSSISAGGAAFAIGGDAQCAAPCAARARAGVGPDVWLSSALSRAEQIAGVRGFLYTGPRVSAGETKGPKTVAFPYGRELGRYSEMLSGHPLPSFVAASPTDLDGAGTEATFEQSFAGFPRPFGEGGEVAGLVPAGRSAEGCAGTPGCQTAYYAMSSRAAGGDVRVIVLDDSLDVDPSQLNWLKEELQGAAGEAPSNPEPAIVVGNADLSAQIASGDAAALEVGRALIAGGASAYFYDSPERNVKKTLSIAGNSIPEFGSGTLGYVNYQAESSGAFLGASGFLVGEVNVAARNAKTNVAPVTVKLIPDIGELALEAQDGTLLRRSQAALFAALARRPRAGNRAQNGSTNVETDPYIPIPSNCVGSACEERIVPEYSFSSSNTEYGDFVKPNLASPDPHAVLLNPSTGEPIHDSTSGLLCAYNAATITVTISAGGLSASLPVTIQPGSVRQPCGTQHLKEVAAQQTQVSAPAPPPPSPSPVSANPTPAAAAPAPLVPVPPAPAVSPTPTIAHPTPLPPFLLPAALTPAPLAFVPPPLPTPARPTPPSGTSAVTSPIEVAEHEEEEEEATESVSNKAVAYRASEHEPSPVYLLGIVLLAAFAGASVRRRPRRGTREVRVAPATITTMRRQRQLEREHSRRNGVTKW